MKRLFGIVFALTLLWAASAFAWGDGVNSGTATTGSLTVTLAASNTSGATTPTPGDMIIVFIEKANQSTVTPPSGYNELTCGSTVPLKFNSTGNQLDIFTHTYAAGDPTSLSFTYTSTVTSWIAYNFGGTSGSNICRATGNASSTTDANTVLGTITPSLRDQEVVNYYVALGTSITLTPNNLTTDSTTTVQHLVRLQGTTPSAGLYELNVGPLASPSSLGAAPTATLSSAAVSAVATIVLSASSYPSNAGYPAASTKQNASGVAYFSQIDQPVVPGTTAWQSPAVDIIALFKSWYATETACDVFDWDSWDNAIIAARQFGKRISFGLNPLGTTPPQSGASNWIYGSSTCTNSTTVDNVYEKWNQTYGPAKCTGVYIPVPWDTNYEHAADDMSAKLHSRYSFLAGPGKPIVSMKPGFYGGLGTIEETYYNAAEGANLGSCTQTNYANGTNTANFYGATEDWAHLASAGAWTTALATGAIAHYEADVVSNFPNTQIINQLTGAPNQPPITGLSPNTINTTLFTADKSSYPHQLVFEMYNGLACSATGRAGSPGCFDAYTAPNNFLPANDPNVSVGFQTLTNMSTQDSRSGNGTCTAASTPWPCCSGSGTGTCTTLYTPLATAGGDANVPTIMTALKDGATYYEAYPVDIADATYAVPWLQMYSNWANHRNQPVTIIKQPSAPVTYFGWVAPGRALPTADQCSIEITGGTSNEIRPENVTANATIPTAAELAPFHLAPTNFVGAPPASDFATVNGNYAGGSTLNDLRWAACKWGIDENTMLAEAWAETNWESYNPGDLQSTQSLCQRGDWNGWDPVNMYCYQSYGILQIKRYSYNTSPMDWDSTSFNADFRGAFWRACMNGDASYLDTAPVGGNPGYPLSNGSSGPPNTAAQMEQGCLGSWFAGNWYSTDGINYANTVNGYIATTPWLTTTANPANLTITSPANGATVSGSSVTVSISMPGHGTDPNSCYACLSIDTAFQTCTPSTGPWTWNTTLQAQPQLGGVSYPALNGHHAINVNSYQCGGQGPYYHAGIDVTVAN